VAYTTDDDVLKRYAEKHRLLDSAECGVREEKVVLPYEIENSLFCNSVQSSVEN
jgi:hypothetical protein